MTGWCVSFSVIEMFVFVYRCRGHAFNFDVK